mmetsp:Transcript_5458/g.10888  ORF Transcript_5458/g.10888 Transcript_5458/m.10888 type:complete len:204 (+) Transcript_5458:169-780(+)|eukprot:scaffold205_cov148-Amphora_coffeaeformis.AAC.3
MPGRARGDRNLRKRKTKESSNDATAVEPMDEDEQAAMIDKLEADSLQQAASMLRLFRSMCIMAAVVLMLSVLYLDQWHMASSSSYQLNNKKTGFVRALSLVHGLSSAVLHILSPNLNNPRHKISLLVRVAMGFDAFMAVSTLWAARLRREDEDNDETLLWMHYGIVASNVFVVLAAMLLRWDGESTDKALENLRQAQYRYKSL